MSHLKRLILLAFFSLLVACGQKGALILEEESSPDKEVSVLQQPTTTKTDKKEAIE